MKEARSVAIEPGLVFPKAREMYEQGVALEDIKRFLHLSESEMRDVAPEEFEDEFMDTEPKGVGGY